MSFYYARNEAITIITIKTKDLKPIGILENAFAVSREKRVNELWQASFSLPIDDPKNALCEHFNVVEIVSDRTGRYHGLYRIIPENISKTNHTITYQCEHVLATLLDDVIDGYNQYTNYTTTQILQFILDLQETKNWVLGRVDFERYFHYAFEDENGLLAPILSIPQPFDEQYEFTFDTQNYPWTLNLIKVSDEPKCEFRWGKDMDDFSTVSDPTTIVNHLIPKGAGEGVNKLTIADVNNSKRYLEDQASIKKWGKRKYIHPDKRFEDKASLKANGESLLRQWKDPKFSFEAKGKDISVLPEYKHEEKILNAVCRITVDDDVYFGRILVDRINDLDEEWNAEYEINDMIDDMATNQADVERKQQVNDAYSQGATNLDSYTFNDNADSDFPAIIEFPFPDDMVNVNESKLRIKISKFRGYTRGSEAGGQHIQESVVQSKSTEDGGAYVQESVVKSESTEDGGAFQKPSEVKGVSAPAGGGHYHKMIQFTRDTPNASAVEREFFVNQREGNGMTPINLSTASPGNLYTYEADGDHTHDFSVEIPGINIQPHTHGFSITIPGITIPKHSHGFSVTIPAINIKAHTHKQIYGIYEHDSLPSSLNVKVDGVAVPFNGTSGEIDITDHLRKDSNGKVTRDYHTIEVAPNDLARISMIVTNRFFIRSHIGGTF